MRRSDKGYSDWAGSTAATCRSICVLARRIPFALANTQRNWSRFRPDVILAAGGFTTQLLLQETRTVPIIFTIVPDPVGSGFVESLSQPGGNAIGFMQFEYSLSGKWLELLKQIAPKRNAGGHPLGPHHTGRDRPVRRDPVRGAVTRGRRETNQCEQRVRDRTRHRCVRESAKWRFDCNGERFDDYSSRIDQYACGQAQTSGGRSQPGLYDRRRSDLLWR